MTEKYKKAVLEAASSLSHEYSEHFWKEVLQKDLASNDQVGTSPHTNESVKNGFLFYLNATGGYLMLREHLRSAISSLIQQKMINMHPSGFHNHRDFQAFLHDMYVYLVDEMHEILFAATLQESSSLASSLDRLLQQSNCEDEAPTKEMLHQSQITNLGIFAEEALAQGDFESCHKLHLQRTCKDGESTRCWMDFALMWLSQRDDKKAEVAVTNILKKDPQHIYALIISGVILAKQADAKGLEFLKAALELLPASPEILVIMAIAYSLFGNDQDAEGCFKKAAYINRILLGQSTMEIEALFENQKKPFNMQEFVSDLEGTTSSWNSPQTQKLGASSNTQLDQTEVVTDSDVGRKLSKKQSQGFTPPRVSTIEEKRKSMTKKKASIASAEYERRGSGSAGKKSSVSTPPKSEVEETNAIIESLRRPSKILESLKDLKLSEVELPPFVNSIRSPWDITEHSEKMERYLLTVEYLDFGKKESRETPASYDYIPNDDGIAPDSAIEREYDMIVGRTSDGETTFKTKRESSARNSTGSGSVPTTAVTTLTDHDRGDTEKLERMCDRVGSELIWAASLLLNLRLYDFLDGVLAKQLFFYGKRTIQFIYLRALSLHLRQRDEEALRHIKEAIEIDGSDGRYWTLEGHCHYNQGNADEAVDCYEKALKLPHTNENRHLLYLRYGSLVLDAGKAKLAKRVFLMGVTKYPTPFMWIGMGNVCAQRGEYHEAESAYSEANRLDNTNPTTWGYLAVSSLQQDKKDLAEQAYKWAVRFGLKAGPLLDDISRLQKEKGFGDPTFPRVPNCIPHDYFLRRMGKTRPFNIYKEALNQDRPRMEKERYADTEREMLLKRKQEQCAVLALTNTNEEEWGGEGYTFFGGIDGYNSSSRTSHVGEISIPDSQKDSPPELVNIKTTPSLMTTSQARQSTRGSKIPDLDRQMSRQSKVNDQSVKEIGDQNPSKTNLETQPQPNP